MSERHASIYIWYMKFQNHQVERKKWKFHNFGFSLFAYLCPPKTGILNQDLYRTETPQVKKEIRKQEPKVTTSSCHLMRNTLSEGAEEWQHGSTMTYYMNKNYSRDQYHPLLSLRWWLNDSFFWLEFEEALSIMFLCPSKLATFSIIALDSCVDLWVSASNICALNIFVY